MRTDNSTPLSAPWDRLRARFVRARRALSAQGPAYRWGLPAAALVVLATVAYLATPVGTSTAYLASGRHFATDEINRIDPELAAKHITWRADGQGRIEVSSDRLDEADSIVAKLRVGTPSLQEIRDNAEAQSSPFDLSSDKHERELKAKEATLAAMIRQLEGIVWAYVTINRPKPPWTARTSARPSAFVYLQTEGERAISYKTVQSILSYIAGSEVDLKHDAVTICDMKGRRYLDPFDPKLNVVSRTKAREEELSQDILEQLDCIKGVRVTVQLVAAPSHVETALNVPAPAPVKVTAPSADDEPEPVEPTVGVNQPVELPPEPRIATVATPIAAPQPEPVAAPTEKARVWVRVPHSFYLKAIGKRNPSEEDLRRSVERTEQIVKRAVAFVFPPNEAFELTVDTTPEDVGNLGDITTAAPPDARRSVSWWVPAGVAAALTAALATVAVRVLAARRPVARLARAELRGRFKVDAGGTEPGPGPSERVRELIRLSPESAATVLNRWIGQGGDVQ